MIWDGFNKRKFPRVACRCEITIQSKTETPPILTKTENIGAGGVCVILDKQLERFSNCELKLNIAETNLDIQCTGRVAWIVPTRGAKEKKSRYDTGIEFVDLKEESEAKLRSFLLQFDSLNA